MIWEALIYFFGWIVESWISVTGFREVDTIMRENLDKQSAVPALNSPLPTSTEFVIHESAH